MTQPGFGRIPTEVVDGIAECLEPSDLISFRLACKQAATQKIQTAIQRYLSTWRTSLTGSHLERLEGISRHAELRKHVKTIWIEDDCERNDPYSSDGTLQSLDIWPRDGTGKVISSQIGVESLKAMLVDKRLRPETIKIRDYRIALMNLRWCSETTKTRDYRAGTTINSDPEPAAAAAALARDIIDGADLAIVSVSMRSVNLPLSDDSILHVPKLAQGQTHMCLSGPRVLDMTISLSPQHQGQGVGFSFLRSAELKVAPYWLEQVLYHAPILEDLNLSLGGSPRDTAVFADIPIPKLKHFELHGTHSAWHAHSILAILANSKHTLTHISLIQVTLNQGSTWRELLSSIGADFHKLTSLHLRFPRQNTVSQAISEAVSFLGFTEDAVAEECRSGLELREKGPPDQRRLTWVLYRGPSAGAVMVSLAAYETRVGVRR